MYVKTIVGPEHSAEYVMKTDDNIISNAHLKGRTFTKSIQFDFKSIRRLSHCHSVLCGRYVEVTMVHCVCVFLLHCNYWFNAIRVQ